MATLEEIYGQLDPRPSPAQWCFVQNYIARERATILGHRSRVPAAEVPWVDPPLGNLPNPHIPPDAHIITATVNGREVQIILPIERPGGSTEVQVRINQGNGRWEGYTALIDPSDNSRITNYFWNWDGTPIRDSTSRTLHGSLMVNGVEVGMPPVIEDIMPEGPPPDPNFRRPPLPQHRRLDGYHRDCGGVSSVPGPITLASLAPSQ